MIPFLRGRFVQRGALEATRALAAPTLDWTSASTDTTPDFDVVLDAGTQAGDTLYLQYSATNFGAYTELSDTLDDNEISSGRVSIPSPELADGTYYFRIKVNSSAYSNVETVTIAERTHIIDGDYGPIFTISGTNNRVLDGILESID